MAFQQPRTRPLGERGLGCGNSLLGVLDRALRIDTDHIGGVGGIDVLALAAAGPLAVDQVLEDFAHHVSP